MLVRKTLQLVDAALKADGDTGRFSGYASVFGGVDSYGDTIVKGAFELTLKKHGKPKMFFGHNWGTLPIGKWTVAKEDDHGLYVEGELTLASSMGRDVYAALKHGTLDGLSVGGFVTKGDFDETETGRVIRRWSVLKEISPVTFPADASATVDLASVKGEDLTDAIAEVETIRDLERLLRDAGGFSKGAATALVARVKAVLGIVGEPEPQSAEAKAMADVRARVEALASRLPS
ncbi:HK97 family phage prohead protease [Nostoc sp. NIES-2111]